MAEASVLAHCLQRLQQHEQYVCLLCPPLGGRPGRQRVMRFLGHLLRQERAAQNLLPASHSMTAPSLLQDRLLVCLHRANESPPLPANCTGTKKTVRESWRVSHTVYANSSPVYAYRYDVINESILPDAPTLRATLIRCCTRTSTNAGGEVSKRRTTKVVRGAARLARDAAAARAAGAESCDPGQTQTDGHAAVKHRRSIPQSRACTCDRLLELLGPCLQSRLCTLCTMKRTAARRTRAADSQDAPWSPPCGAQTRRGAPPIVLGLLPKQRLSRAVMRAPRASHSSDSKPSRA